MEAVSLNGPFDVTVIHREVPRPAHGEALVAMTAAGVCAGDVYMYRGANPYATYPRVAGHEVSGVVTALGPATKGPGIGARVVLEPFLNCGTCYPCRIGRPNCCTDLRLIGAHCDGGFADYFVAPVERLHPVPEGLDDFRASFAEPVAIGVQACRRGRIAADDRVLVLGAGPIGLAILEVARARGATVHIADPDQARLAAAERLGGQPLAAAEGLLPEVLRLTGGEGMPVVMEASGSVAAMESTVDLVASGGRIVIVGLAKRGATVSIPALDFTRKEMTISGSRASHDCFPDALALLAAGAIRYPDVAESFVLRDAPDVFRQLSGNNSLIHKAVFIRERS